MEEQGKMGMREYRKGNWTIQETMILIEAKKMDDERRKLSKKQAYHNIITTSPSSNINTSTSMSMSTKPVTELRWKWVEEYCWRKGCLRSQNQCNDKWDNLMRDYKKIRDFSRNLLISNKGGDNYDQHEEISGNVKVKSYWEMDKVERKDKGLPTNMLPQIYQALFDVVESSGSGSGSGCTTPSSVGVVAAVAVAGPTQFLQLPPPSPPPPLQLQMSPLPFYSPQSQVQVQPQPLLQVLPTLELEASEQSQPESSAKRRRKEERVIIEASVPEGTSTDAPTTTTTTTTTTPPTLQDISSAICRSASIISEAIQANEQNEERRHKEIMQIHETRLRFEESRLEVTRQGFNGLNDAINKLANSILTWANASHRSHQGP
ncbi:uncharacterized protein LOC141596243 [Silene latifolia]|uniref:uncharacterized protein LOC141596243 n=1 Tax=Silene latifolia TaxID=37657 RepID=UPI003D78147F